MVFSHFPKNRTPSMLSLAQLFTKVGVLRLHIIELVKEVHLLHLLRRAYCLNLFFGLRECSIALSELCLELLLRADRIAGRCGILSEREHARAESVVSFGKLSTSFRLFGCLGLDLQFLGYDLVDCLL